MLSPSQVRARIHLLRPWRYNQADRMIQAYASLLCLALCEIASWVGIDKRRCWAVFSAEAGTLGFLPPTCGSPSTGMRKRTLEPWQVLTWRILKKQGRSSEAGFDAAPVRDFAHWLSRAPTDLQPLESGILTTGANERGRSRGRSRGSLVEVVFSLALLRSIYAVAFSPDGLQLKTEDKCLAPKAMKGDSLECGMVRSSLPSTVIHVRVPNLRLTALNHPANPLYLQYITLRCTWVTNDSNTALLAWGKVGLVYQSTHLTAAATIQRPSTSGMYISDICSSSVESFLTPSSNDSSRSSNRSHQPPLTILEDSVLRYSARVTETSMSKSSSTMSFDNHSEARRRPRFSGWRVGAALSNFAATAVLLTNIGAIIGLTSVYGADGSGIGTVIKGQCSKIKNASLWMHLAINALSTVLLSASNYCMQALSAPTRAEVDKAHGKKEWIDIGVPSIRNLAKISKRRVYTWLLLGFSSLPLHLLSVILAAPAPQHPAYDP